MRKASVAGAFFMKGVCAGFSIVKGPFSLRRAKKMGIFATFFKKTFDFS